MNGEIVPFGKYKGQPVETLTADADYCEWLIAQPWFSSKYRNVYNIVIQGGAEPQDSPEHNEMQARFLDDGWCFALADLLRPRRKGTYGLEAARKLLDADPGYQAFRDCCELKTYPAEIVPRRFEDRGWDVVYGVEPASISARRTRLVPPLPACSCTCDHTACAANARCRGGSGYCRHDSDGWHREREGIDSTWHCCDDCYWSSKGPLTYDQRSWLKETLHEFQPGYGGIVRVELKPDLGDDYPAVLRQVTGYPGDYADRRCVVARRYAFERVTWDQVRKIFAASQVTLLAESEITSPPSPADAPDPEGQALALVEDRLGGEVVAP